jgi:hypothetical protein
MKRRDFVEKLAPPHKRRRAEQCFQESSEEHDHEERRRVGHHAISGAEHGQARTQEWNSASSNNESPFSHGNSDNSDVAFVSRSVSSSSSTLPMSNRSNQGRQSMHMTLPYASVNPAPNITGSIPFRVGGRGVEPIASSVLLEPQQRQQVIQLLEAHAISERDRQNEAESLLASISQDTTLRASVAAGAAHSSMTLFQQQLQQQQRFRYLEELAAVLTIQQVRENPGILGSLSSALATAPAHHRTPPQPQLALNPLAGISQAPLLLRAQTQQQPQQDLAQSNALQALLSRETLPPRDAAPLPNVLRQPRLPPIQQPNQLPFPIGISIPLPVRTADVYMPRDDETLSDHQILLRKQLEFFEAAPDDIQAFAASRRQKISVGQVGIRCKHCARGLEKHRYVRGTMYFPSTLRSLYQAAQNCGKVHLSDKCPTIDDVIKTELKLHMEAPTNSGHGGKPYWGEGAMLMGVFETETGLRFAR